MGGIRALRGEFSIFFSIERDSIFVTYDALYDGKQHNTTKKIQFGVVLGLQGPTWYACMHAC